MCALASLVVHRPASPPASTSRSRHWAWAWTWAGLRDLDLLIQKRRKYFLFAGSQARPISTRVNPDRPPLFESAARPASTKETRHRSRAKKRHLQRTIQDGAESDHAYETGCRPTWISVLGKPRQWRRNRVGRFTHSRSLTTDLGRRHGVGGSADGYLGTNTTPHTVILDKASSATAPPRNGTRTSRLDSATSSALYEPTRLALSGMTRSKPIIGNFPEATILTFLH